jgi:molecular chaperone Hsp33
LALLNTLKTEEFLDSNLLVPDILYRLFHSEGLNVFKGISLKAECYCSKEKLAVVFHRFSKQDLLSLLENDQIKANCEFCNTTYDFTRMELKL